MFHQLMMTLKLLSESSNENFRTFPLDLFGRDLEWISSRRAIDPEDEARSITLASVRIDRVKYIGIDV